MPMLADLVDAVIGVDTHTAAVVDRLGAHLATIEIRADASGYAQLIAFASSKPPARRSPGRSMDAALTAPAWPPR
jgi:transposase